MPRFLFVAFLFLNFCSLYAEEQKPKQEQEEMTQTQKLWGRKFQASIAYTYLSTGHQGLDIGYGIWDYNKMGILANIFVPVDINKNNNKLYLISFFWVWDWTPLKWLSVLPKVGYGAKILERNNLNAKQYYLSWEPTIGLDITFNINNYFKIFTSYTWAMYKDFENNTLNINGGSIGFRIAY
ncbi:hypothetical protein [Helicobacter cholecystus]|uniref:hypothetical protein n=1 Tax=Helicobacter cholecystus TaxID=45498 RepID=UPI00273884DC|nr:hypothetical protein [Helicobacter cholecystus]